MGGGISGRGRAGGKTPGKATGNGELSASNGGSAPQFGCKNEFIPFSLLRCPMHAGPTGGLRRCVK